MTRQQRHTIPLIALFALLLPSCSNDKDEPTIVPDDQSPIVIGASIDEEQTITRAATNLESTHQSFKLWGYKNMSVDADGNYSDLQTVFPAYTASWTASTAGSTTSNTSDWEYVSGSQTIKFWDFAAAAYRFLAVAPATTTNANVTISATEATLTLSDLNASRPEAVLYSRLWLGTNSTATHLYGQPVTLEFVRPFAKVRYYFMFGDAITDPDNVEIGNVSFASTESSELVYSQGTLTITYPLCGSSTSETSASASSASSIALPLSTPQADGSYPYTTVLPAPSGQHTYCLTATIDGEVKTALVPAEYMTWKPGYAYTYIFKITEAGADIVLFDVKIDPWHYGGEQTDEWHNW